MTDSIEPDDDGWVPDLDTDITDVGEINRRGLSRKKSKITCTYDDKIGEGIAKLVELGSSLEAAAKACGLNPSTVKTWYLRGKGKIDRLPNKAMYRRFYRMVRKAQGKALANSLERISQAAIGGTVFKKKVTTKANGDEIVEEVRTPPDPKVDMWLLERLDRDRFGASKKIEHSGDRPASSVNIQNNIAGNLTDGERLLLAKLLEKANADPTDGIVESPRLPPPREE